MKTVSILRAAAWAGLVILVSGMQTALAEPLVYVPLGGEGKIVVVDAGQDNVVGKIEGLPAVHGLAGTPDGRFLIAGSYAEDTEGAEAPAKPAGMSEDEHAAHHAKPTGKVDTPQPSVSTISIVRTADRAVVRRIDVPGAVHHVAVSPDGRYAIVTHPNQDSVSAIDLASFEVVSTVATGPVPNYAVFSADSTSVYVTNAGNDTISEVDTAGWIKRRDYTVGNTPEHLVLSADGNSLFVNNVDAGTVSILSLKLGRVVKTIPVGKNLHGIDLSVDGSTLFVSAMGDNKLVAINLSTGADRSAELVPAPYHLATVHGTDKLYVASAEEPKVWVVDQGTLEVVGEIPIGGKAHQMVQVASE